MKATDWSKRPHRRKHRLFGVKQVWVGLGGRFAVERFPAGSKRYIAVECVDAGGTRLVGDFPNLVRAQRACERVGK